MIKTDKAKNQTVGNEFDGMTEEEIKAEKKRRQIANLRPFKPLDQLTPEEAEKQKALIVKGGKARQAQLQKAKTWKEQALALLGTKVSREQAKAMLGEDVNLIPEDADLTVQGVLTVKAMQEFILNGNVKSLEFLRDTSGQKPTNEIEITADIMTDDDRKLLESVSNRLNVG